MNSFVNQFLAFHSIFGHQENGGPPTTSSASQSSNSVQVTSPESVQVGAKDGGSIVPNDDGSDSLDPPPLAAGTTATTVNGPQRKRFRVAVDEDGGMANGNKVFTDDIDDLCQCTCKVCMKSMTSKSLKEHIRKQHKLGPEEYISRYGEIHYTKLTYHRCQMCKRTLKAVVNVISNHLKKCHNINFQEYRTKFNVFNGVHTGKRKFFIKKNSVSDTSSSEQSNSLDAEKMGRYQPNLPINSQQQLMNMGQQQIIDSRLKQQLAKAVVTTVSNHSVSNIISFSGNNNSNDQLESQQQDKEQQDKSSDFLRSFYFTHFMANFQRLNETIKQLSVLSEENKLQLINTQIINNSSRVDGVRPTEEIDLDGKKEVELREQITLPITHQMSTLEETKTQGIKTLDSGVSLDLSIQQGLQGLQGVQGLDLSKLQGIQGLDLSKLQGLQGLDLGKQEALQGLDLNKQAAAAAGLQGVDLGLQGLQGVQQWMLNLQNGFHPGAQQVEEGIDHDGRVYTNNVKEFCVAQCHLCNKNMTIKSLREHVRHRHNQSIREYKKKYGDMCYTKITYHRCKFCCKSMKASVSTISTHLKKQHSVSFQQYRAIFKIFQDVKRRRRL